MNFKKATLAAALALGLFGIAHADLTVGVVLPLTGPASGLGIPTLDGLGAVGEGAHAAHESVMIDSLVPRAALLARLIESL